MSATPAAGPSESVPQKSVEKRRLHAVSEGGTSKFWQLATLIVPIVLTTFLTFWVSQKEDSIKQDIEKQNQLFSQQLQLSEELYKRRFDAYDKLDTQLVRLNERLEAQHWDKTSADQVAQLSESLALSRLHMGPKVEPLIFPVWIAGARGDGPLLAQSIHDLEAAMKTELDEWMVAKKEAPSPASAASKLKKSKQNRSAQ